MQLAAIRKELGEGDDDVVAEYRERLEPTSRPPTKVKLAIARELDRLERTSSQSPEHGWIRTWLDRIFELPWGTRSDDTLDLAVAAGVLDDDHYGLSDVKDRIVEFLAVHKLRHERGVQTTGRGSGAIITLVGPPGVGKTSLGESIARAMGRKFVRVALGGVRDEAEIRGHRRTYVGSQPGRIVRALTEAGTMNPVILLDEVDKLTAGRLVGRSHARRCSRCSTPPRTTRSATTTSRSISTCPRSCSSPPPTSPTRSPVRCSTGWSSCASTATPRTRRSSSPVATCCRASSSGRA